MGCVLSELFSFAQVHVHFLFIITYGGWLAFILEMHYAFLPVWIIAFISAFTYIDACADSRHIWKETHFKWLIEQRRFLVLTSLFFKIYHMTDLVFKSLHLV